MKNGPLRPVFRRKSVFPRGRVRVGGADGTKVPFRCNSLRRSTPAGQPPLAWQGQSIIYREMDVGSDWIKQSPEGSSDQSP